MAPNVLLRLNKTFKLNINQKSLGKLLGLGSSMKTTTTRLVDSASLGFKIKIIRLKQCLIVILKYAQLLPC